MQKKPKVDCELLKCLFRAAARRARVWCILRMNRSYGDLERLMIVSFTKQQVDQDLLPSQSVTPRETHNSANDPRDAVPCKR